ncbi:class II fructose-bisphosphate aldolase [[Acholeplasma] multilocale]|uniref:class II fructose-bisphosphate aldolase n=1 Tax=[Acholeplasma] multilocale TaxID=264638 RepID=UPI00047C89D9|nr:class II fructose-bisphosphate aldolase [[Acholeplasma] multilocale]
MKASLKKELSKAKKGHYAVPAFNFDNLEMMKGIIEAAEERKSPVILMVTESAAKYMGLDNVFALAVSAAKKSTVPVILHWDHGFEIALIKRAIDAGFSSVMLDSSLKSFADNVTETREVVQYAHARGVEVESEIGHVGGKEDDRISNGNGYTNVDEAVKFNELTNVDALAIAAGTAHGVFKTDPELQFDLIEEIVYAIDTPIVLHGSSGVPLVDLQKAISLGITKINIGTDLKIAACQGIRHWLGENKDGYDARKYGRMSIDYVKAEAMKKIDAFGSDGKA